MSDREEQRPNIIVILTDDQGCWAMGCAGNKEIRTPNLDRLAASGTLFDRFYCVSPVCSPARASLLTGSIPSKHGVHDWLRSGTSTIEPDIGGRLIEYLRGQPGYTDVLAASGYVCGLSGKWHLGDAHHAQKGFTFWKAHARGGGSYYYAPMVKNETDVCFEPRYVTDVITDNALDFLEQRLGKPDPFYLSLHYTAPHSPWERGEHPAIVFNHYHDNCAFGSVPHVPRHPHADGGLARDFYSNLDRRREMLSGYYAAVTAMDANVGRVLDWLETNRLRDETLILFTSDNGMNMGHHGIVGKGNGTFPLNMYETSVRVPAIFSRPGHVPAGVVNADLLSHYDVMPTLLDYLGMANPGADALPGRSFAPVLCGQPLPPREHVVVFDEYGPVRMIRDERFKYVHRYPDGPHELYDLERDQNEEHNLAAEPAHAERIRSLRHMLEAWFNRYTDTRLDGKTKPVNGAGQIDLADKPGAFNNDWSASWWPDGFVPPGEERGEGRTLLFSPGNKR